jgi:hypothetical protein
MEQMIQQLMAAMSMGGAGAAGGAMQGATPMATSPQAGQGDPSDLMKKQAMADAFMSTMGAMAPQQVDPYGATPNVVGPSGYTQSGAPVEKPRMDPAQSMPKDETAGTRMIMHNGQPISLKAMTHEDEPNGYWDAKRQGNGRGRSFYAVDDEVFYLD